MGAEFNPIFLVSLEYCANMFHMIIERGAVNKVVVQVRLANDFTQILQTRLHISLKFSRCWAEAEGDSVPLMQSPGRYKGCQRSALSIKESLVIRLALIQNRKPRAATRSPAYPGFWELDVDLGWIFDLTHDNHSIASDFHPFSSQTIGEEYGDLDLLIHPRFNRSCRYSFTSCKSGLGTDV